MYVPQAADKLEQLEIAVSLTTLGPCKNFIPRWCAEALAKGEVVGVVVCVLLLCARRQSHS